MRLVLDVDQTEKRSSELLPVRCRLLHEGSGATVIVAPVDLAEAPGTKGIGACYSGKHGETRSNSGHLHAVLVVEREFSHLKVGPRRRETDSCVATLAGRVRPALAIRARHRWPQPQAPRFEELMAFSMNLIE